MKKIIRLFKQLFRNKFSFNLIGYYLKRTTPLLYYPFVRIRKPNKVVFFIGNQGDGMSFVTRVIRRNHKIITITGNHKYWSGADELATVMEPVLPYSLRLPGILTKEKLISKLDPPRSWSYGADPFFKHYLSTDDDLNSKDKRKFLKSISTAFKRFGSDKIFIDKSQVYSLKMRLIQMIFKDKVYFVHITRNPLVSCYRASTGKAADLKRYSKDLEFNDLVNISTQHWNNVSNEISKSIKYVNNYSKFKIEDILKEPASNFKKICDFIGVEFDEKMLPSPEDSLPRFSKYEDRWFPIREDINSSYLNKMDLKTKIMILEKLNKNLVEEQEYTL